MRDAWPNSREASKSVAFTSSTVAPVETGGGVGGSKTGRKVHREEESGEKMFSMGKTEICHIQEKERQT